MTISSPFIIALSSLDESVLQARARASTAAHGDVIRARIVLAAAEGATNTQIAAEVGVYVDTVRQWRRRFATVGLPGLEDRPRSGRRRGFTPIQVAEVKALACTLHPDPVESADDDEHHHAGQWNPRIEPRRRAQEEPDGTADHQRPRKEPPRHTKAGTCNLEG
jgi:hypothetical protein